MISVSGPEDRSLEGVCEIVGRRCTPLFVARNYRFGYENSIVSLLEHGFDGWLKVNLIVQLLSARVYVIN